MEVGTSEAEPIWTEFLRRLTRRGLRGVKLVVSDAHEGLKAAVTKVLNATWQRCRVHFMRNVLAHAGKSGRRVVSNAYTRRVTITAPIPPSRGSAWPRMDEICVDRSGAASRMRLQHNPCGAPAPELLPRAEAHPHVQCRGLKGSSAPRLRPAGLLVAAQTCPSSGRYIMRSWAHKSETNTIPYAVIWSTIGSTFILMQLGAPKEIDRVVSAMARC